MLLIVVALSPGMLLSMVPKRKKRSRKTLWLLKVGSFYQFAMNVAA